MALKANPIKKSSKKTKELISPPESIDPDWRTKIAIAKMVAEAAKETRKGKPIAAKTHRWGPY